MLVFLIVKCQHCRLLLRNTSVLKLNSAPLSIWLGLVLGTKCRMHSTSSLFYHEENYYLKIIFKERTVFGGANF